MLKISPDRIIQMLALAGFGVSVIWLLSGGNFPALISLFTSSSVLIKLFLLSSTSGQVKES